MYLTVSEKKLGFMLYLKANITLTCNMKRRTYYSKNKRREKLKAESCFQKSV